MTARHGGQIRTEWFEGPFTKADAERFAAFLDRVNPPVCGRGAGDRTEGAFATKHYGVQTVGVRGCEKYRNRIMVPFLLTAEHLSEGTFR